tara:strand:+ start:1962 stop:3776 length:1815 start_codon:yes stop_codon:yes gene_type:complete
MSFYCSDDTNIKANLMDVIFNSIPKNNTLWMPEVQKIDSKFFEDIYKYSFYDIIMMICKNILFKDETFLTDDELLEICKECFNFDVPLIQLNESLYCFELFHGPTLTFKDFGTRFLSRIIKKIIKEKYKNQQISVIVSTSGDTGSAVADAFYEMDNIIVHILYPKNLISDIQEKQIINYGKNIFAYEVDGTFDDCQGLVKQLIEDKTINQKVLFFPANSINIIRLIPQSFYYFWCYRLLRSNFNYNCKSPILISVPSGNLGNLTGGILAIKMGLPISFLISATNSNKAFFTYLYKGVQTKYDLVQTISSAMDVSVPSNLIRLRSLFDNDCSQMRKYIICETISEIETTQTMEYIYNKYQYSIDPHTSVGFKAILNNYSIKNINIVFATAHPAKFPVIMNKLNIPFFIPKQIKNLNNNFKKIMNNNYQEFKNNIIFSSKFKKITLIGMPGVGKSYIGNLLSRNLKWSCLDIDILIENKYKRKLKDIIDIIGSDQFKSIEELLIYELKILDNTIISPGGSIIYEENAIKKLQKESLIIFLNDSFETIDKRIPSLHERGIIINPKQTFLDLYLERLPLYQKYSDITINCQKKNENEIISEIKKFLLF